MQLYELLEELRENVLHDRSDRVAGSDDYLWSDKTLVRYIDQAQRRLARRALVLRDAITPKCCQFTTNTTVDGLGMNKYDLDDSVIAVLSCRMTGDTADLARASHSAFDTYRVPDTYFFDPSSLSALPPGKPLAYDTDESLVFASDGELSTVSLRIYPAPDAAHAGVVGNMRVIRMPLAHLTMDAMKAIPEVPEALHLDMLDWAAYLALRKVDVDAGDAARAEEFRERFEATVAEARQEMMRKEFQPAVWSFGRNGFTWERDGQGGY